MSTKRVTISVCDMCGAESRRNVVPYQFGPLEFCITCTWGRGDDGPCHGSGDDHNDPGPHWWGNCSWCWERAMQLPRGKCGATYTHGAGACTLPAGHNGGHQA
jgi:hypothetical protein